MAMSSAAAAENGDNQTWRKRRRWATVALGMKRKIGEKKIAAKHRRRKPAFSGRRNSGETMAVFSGENWWHEEGQQRIESGVERMAKAGKSRRKTWRQKKNIRKAMAANRRVCEIGTVISMKIAWRVIESAPVGKPGKRENQRNQ
jgi:hypothetical protein